MFWNNFRLPDIIWTARRCSQGWLHSAFLPLALSPPSSSSSTSPASLPSGGSSSFHTFYATKLTTRRTLLTHLRGLLYLAIVTCSSAKVGSIKLWQHCNTWWWFDTSVSGCCPFLQCGGVVAFLLLGPLPPPLSFAFHLVFYFGALLSEATLVTIILTRIFIAYQVRVRIHLTCRYQYLLFFKLNHKVVKLLIFVCLPLFKIFIFHIFKIDSQLFQSRWGSATWTTRLFSRSCFSSTQSWLSSPYLLICSTNMVGLTN